MIWRMRKGKGRFGGSVLRFLGWMSEGMGGFETPLSDVDDLI